MLTIKKVRKNTQKKKKTREGWESEKKINENDGKKKRERKREKKESASAWQAPGARASSVTSTHAPISLQPPYGSAEERIGVSSTVILNYIL